VYPCCLVYVELILLHTPLPEVQACIINIKLQESLRKLSRARDQLDNNDVVRWISATATAALSFGRNPSEILSLVDKFNGVLRRLEGLSIE
jgi:hypothetical protein